MIYAIFGSYVVMLALCGVVLYLTYQARQERDEFRTELFTLINRTDVSSVRRSLHDPPEIPEVKYVGNDESRQELRKRMSDAQTT